MGFFLQKYCKFLASYHSYIIHYESLKTILLQIHSYSFTSNKINNNSLGSYTSTTIKFPQLTKTGLFIAGWFESFINQAHTLLWISRLLDLF